ncbi:MAG: NHLP bacteriocin export ABC transporter permease/ATPase subunit [Microcoleaceae cyanobacterium]
MKERTLSGISSILGTQDAGFTKATAPFLVALEAIGKVLGVRISVPSFLKAVTPSVETLEVIAQTSGIRTRRVLLTADWWKHSRSPLLGFTLQQNHPVALLPRGRTYEIYNPSTGHHALITPQTAQSLAQIAYTFYPALPDESIDIRTLWQFALKGCSREIVQTIFVGAIATLLGMLTPQAFGLMVDYAIPNANRGLLAQIGLGLFVASFGVAMFQLAQNISILRLRTRTIFTIQAALWDRLLKLPISFLRSYTVGELYDQVSVASQIGEHLSNLTIQLLLGGVLSLLNLGLLLVYSPTLTGIAVAGIALTGGLTAIAAFLLKPQIRRQQHLQTNSLGLTLQLTRGIGKLRVAGAEERAFLFWARQYNQRLSAVLNQQMFQDRIRLFNALIPTVGLIALFGLGIPLVSSTVIPNENTLSTGTFLAFYTAFGMLMAGVITLSNQVLESLEVVALWRRAKPLLKVQPEVHGNQSDPGQLLGYLKLDQVSFRYDSKRSLVLNRITLEVQPGEFIAIVGSSGSGKSTIVRLLLGFEVPESGAIYYDGQDLSRLNPTTVRRQLGVVLQNGQVYQGTIFENIAGRTLVSMEEVWEAAKVAGLIDEIHRMPMGMHTVVAEGGVNLSGGQRQQLLIARALVSQPQVIIFDEATNGLDCQTQWTVTQHLEQLKTTRIVVSHHSPMVRHADRIYVLEAGRIVQQGKFDQLIQENGPFQLMMASQIRANEA